jgi:hypothetical protein
MRGKVKRWSAAIVPLAEWDKDEWEWHQMSNREGDDVDLE